MKVRIKFRKYGMMKYIGHLDLMRFFQKAIRRAGLDIRYSEGFHPHMIMSFAAPLGVGMMSEGEYFDVDMISSPEPKEAIRLLNAQMADGIEVSAYVPLIDGAKKSMALVEAAGYRYLYAPDAQAPSYEALQAAIRRFYEEASEIPVTKKTKKSERTLDLKPLIHDFSLIREGDRYGFSLFLSAGSTDNVKPELVIEALYQSMGLAFDPLDFERWRTDVYTVDEDGAFITLDRYQTA
jgi:radical SAM-linked protein